MANFVIFDCDGTLVDSQYMIGAAMGRAFRRHNLSEPELADVRAVVGLPLQVAIERLLTTDKNSESKKISDTYKDEFMQLRKSSDVPEPLFSGILKVLEHLAASDILLGIATGKSRRGLEAVLEAHELRRFFTTTWTADDGPGKPSPFMVRSAMAEVGRQPHETAVVGDTTFDIEMAKNAAARAIGVSWGYHSVEALQEAGADHILRTPQELMDQLTND
jgi:phosphoglycolate phosphatase